MTTKPIIAIDGPAASGKGTLAHAMARELGFRTLDTGKLYRAVGLEIIKAGADPENESVALNAAENLHKELAQCADPQDYLSNPALKSDECGAAASMVSQFQSVRGVLLDLQRDFATLVPEPYKGAVLDGRDIGTVICPDADLKLFIKADLEIRAQRRTKELQISGKPATYEAVLKDMRERDKRDAGRKAAPMEPAKDAIIMDSTAMTPENLVEEALRLFHQKVSGF